MKRVANIFLLFVAALLLTGCSSGDKKEVVKSGYQIYYINSDETKLVPKSYVPKSSTIQQMVDEFLEALSRQPASVNYKCAKPDSVVIQDYYIEDEQLYLQFDGNYEQMPNTTEVLMRAAYVRTLVQIPGIKLVGFYIENQPLADSKGTAIGPMNKETFIENSGGEINAYQEADLILYFANKEGNKLIQTTKSLVYSSNISLEKLIMEQLIKGPSDDSKDIYPTISGNTKLISISVKDSICYVNLSDQFLKSTYEVTEDVQIYSIVNSLAELATVNKVQIAINGVTDRTFQDKINFNTIFERNLDIIQTAN